jgi:DNA-binding transcriptional LysR family regulator
MSDRLSNWDDLRIFLAVAKHGSFTRAALELGTTQTTVGRRMAELEQCVGSQLLHRYGKGVRLTRRGSELARRVLAMAGTAQQIERFLVGHDQTLQGAVRLSATDGLITLWLIPQVSEFQKQYPMIRLELVTAGSWASIATTDEDIAIRSAGPTAKRKPAQRVARTRFALYASPAYLRGVKMPQTMEDLLTHRVVENLTFQINPALMEWHAFLNRHPALLAANSAVACFSAVRSGAGIALLPTFYRKFAPELVELDVPLKPVADVWMLLNPDTQQSARVQVVARFVAECFARDKGDWFV